MKSEFDELNILIKQSLNRIKLTRSEKRQLNHIMATCHYRHRLSLYDDQNAIRAHQLFDKAMIPECDRETIWKEQRSKVRSYSEVYNLKPIQDKRDNKDVTVGSGHSHGRTIRYPKKGHKNAWKKFYKLFPRLHPDYNREKEVESKRIIMHPEAEKILKKSRS